jgi:hypothetical protein
MLSMVARIRPALHYYRGRRRLKVERSLVAILAADVVG